jgi:hypothetical protein
MIFYTSKYKITLHSAYVQFSFAKVTHNSQFYRAGASKNLAILSNEVKLFSIGEKYEI